MGFPAEAGLQLRNMNWEKVDIIDYENFLSLGRAIPLGYPTKIGMFPIEDGRLALAEVWHHSSL